MSFLKQSLDNIKVWINEKIAEGALQGSGNAGFGDVPEAAEAETEPADDFMSEWATPEASAQATEPADSLILGWNMPENGIADSMEIFSEDTAPTKIYEPKHSRAESRQVFSEPVQTEKAGNDWMIYG